jgi:hypothetical protein
MANVLPYIEQKLNTRFQGSDASNIVRPLQQQLC